MTLSTVSRNTRAIENEPTSLEIAGLSIVLIGDFNPSIFQPHWLSTNGLIPATEAKEVTDLIVHNELTVFKLPWVSLQATHKQFIASTTFESHFEAVRDLVAGIFSVLKHTPVQKMGINLEQHHRFADVECYKEFGHKLAPKEIWRKTMNDPGLVKMIVRENPRIDGYQGSFQIDLEVSARVVPGVFFRTNDHFDLATSEKPSSTESAMKILTGEFSKSLDRSANTIRTILSIV